MRRMHRQLRTRNPGHWRRVLRRPHGQDDSERRHAVMHDKRRWGVGPAASAEELARKLTGSTWCLCTGFYVVGHEEYLFVNDATHEDGAGEYAVLKGRIGSATYLQ